MNRATQALKLRGPVAQHHDSRGMLGRRYVKRTTVIPFVIESIVTKRVAFGEMSAQTSSLEVFLISRFTSTSAGKSNWRCTDDD